jgi:hypothetical protein
MEFLLDKSCIHSSIPWSKKVDKFVRILAGVLFGVAMDKLLVSVTI